jgi:hypothetical protein
MASVTGGQKAAVILAEIGARIKNAEFVRVGFLEKAKYPDGRPVAMIAAIQEFGAPRAKIPPRPFFRNMIAKHSSSWPQAAANLLKANNYDTRLTLNMVGDAIAGQLRQSIVDTTAPPLSPVTLMLRKMKAQNPGLRVSKRVVWEAARRVRRGESTGGASIKPLVETGHMLQSISWEVR